MVSSSRASSKPAESLAPGVQIGNSLSRSPSSTLVAINASRARIQFRFPCTVLISPLWAMKR